MIEEKLVTSLMTMALMMSLIGVGTYAYSNGFESSVGSTLANSAFNLTINGIEGYSGALMYISDLKPSLTRYSDEINLTIQTNPGKLYKRISQVVCDQGISSEPEQVEESSNGVRYNIDDVTWFDLTVNGTTHIPGGFVTVSDIKDTYIYLGCFHPGKNVTVVQSFHLQPTVTNWAQGDRCVFVEEYLLIGVNDSAPIPCVGNCTACLYGKEPFVVDYRQGLTNDGQPVRPGRSNPNNALYYETGLNEANFFSLGFGGWMIIGYNYPIVNDGGKDVKVIEDTWGTYPPELANVYASQDGVSWTYLGQANNLNRDPVYNYHTISSFDLGPLPWAKYIKVVDVTDPAAFIGTMGADGYDLNAVIAITDCQEPVC